MIGGGSCSLCGSPGTHKGTCPLNPEATKPNWDKHPNAAVKMSRPIAPVSVPKVPAVRVIPKKQTKQAKETRLTKVVMPKLAYGQVGINKEEWLKRKPTTPAERQDLMDRCGAKCFLEPDELKYPVCSKYSCDYDCDGLRTVVGVTAILNNRKNINPNAQTTAKKASGMAKTLGIAHCGWTQNHS